MEMDEPDAVSSKNRETDGSQFRGEKRPNATHESKTVRDAKLYRKGQGFSPIAVAPRQQRIAQIAISRATYTCISAASHLFQQVPSQAAS